MVDLKRVKDKLLCRAAKMMRCRDSEAAAIDCWSANGFETEGRNEGRVVAGGNDFNGLMVFHSPPDTIFYFLGVSYKCRVSFPTTYASMRGKVA